MKVLITHKSPERSHMRLHLSPTIRNEWEIRCIGDVIPALANYDGRATVEVSVSVANEIAADCRFYMDNKAVDATSGERRAYRALWAQITRQLLAK